MGELYGRWSRALDSNLAILTTAKLYTFDSVATTTPKVTYSNAACTVAHPNPVPANPDGTFPQVFAPDGEAYYLVLRSNTIAAGGLIIDSFVNVQSLGDSSAGVLGRDFDTGGKFQFRGDTGLGAVRLEFGDPDPDVLGGTGWINGWAGSQLDTLNVDAVTTKLTGDLAFTGGRKLPGLVALTGTAAAVATLDIQLIQAPFTGVSAWQIDIVELIHSDFLSVRFAYDAVPTYYATADQDGRWIDGTGAGSATGATSLKLHTITSATRPATMSMVVSGSATSTTSLRGQYGAYTGFAVFSGGRASNPNVTPTYIRFIPNSGTITCKWRLIPMRGFAEV